MNGFVFHPEALTDLEEIWDFIATDSLDAADRVFDEIFEAIRSLVQFLSRATDAQTSLRGHCGFSSCGTF